MRSKWPRAGRTGTEASGTADSVGSLKLLPRRCGGMRRPCGTDSNGMVCCLTFSLEPFGLLLLLRETASEEEYGDTSPVMYSVSEPSLEDPLPAPLISRS